MEKKYWRGGTFHVNAKGEIDKVISDHDNKEIKGEKEKGAKKGKEVLRFDPEERCVYSASGNCYCT
jgi:hypothetical protein